MNYHIIHKDSISSALDKANQYRSLLEPDLAISICIDIFAVDPDNQEALVIYILALTDLYSHKNSKVQPKKIIEAIAKLNSEFHRIYYNGIFLERKAKSLLKNSMSQSFAYEGFKEAMSQYQIAEKLAPKNCSDPILRYNSCLRIIEKLNLQPRKEFDELY
jgi:hypothetical protein